ncbi:hypothetical protein [Pseudomonas rubra]|uniref:Uncharacterized protein n=1 Tax=Pseudomonas rubra TaxID=2942627 RepID=A0ABT5P4M2_9PSED|nr:hypothetical protein [Pseudomonas rubra]MDD1013242.1 hypothetical protein [Pseudomonas rubra]MDD1037545.1 hypothetical protein [Pseudomonas rubra]MDD1155567.1 hypothetical protein [Pseudomonas rubra]
MKDPRKQSFCALVNCTTPGHEGVVGISRTSRSMIVDLATSGWLQVVSGRNRGDMVGSRFRFDYLETKGDRIHYHISGDSEVENYYGRKLGVSRNGYLGLYENGASPFWKLELIGEWDGTNGLDFYLRDHQGHEVSNYEYANSWFLNVYEGARLSFKATNIKFLET